MIDGTTPTATNAVPPIHDLVRPCRTITGMSAVLLPMTDDGVVDWPGFDTLLGRTLEAGLVPAVNMDTGYANLLDEDTLEAVLARTADACDDAEFVAGTFVADSPGAAWNPDAYRARIAQISGHGGTPVIFQSFGLSGLPSDDLLAAYATMATEVDRFIAFELGTQFAPFGRIYDLETYRGLLDIPQCVGAKHSSLSRDAEWRRLVLRDAHRPDFMVLTGNDLAIDMVMYGSDYLLGLSAFAPDAFARRDAMWAAGDPGFHQLNDVLQYLGAFAFRAPVPAYKHDAARFLRLRGWLRSSATHPDSPTRPDADDDVLAVLRDRLDEEMSRA